MQNIKMSWKEYTDVLYIFLLVIYIISNVSNNVQTQ